MVALLVMVSAYIFLKEYGRYLARVEKLEAMKVRLRVSRNQLQETTRKHRVFSRVQTFLNRTKSLGLTHKKWATYNVNIEEPVTFDTLEQILNQCNNTPLYYFNPISLQITATADSEETPNRTANQSGQIILSKEDRGDITIDLKGSFIVREKL